MTQPQNATFLNSGSIEMTNDELYFIEVDGVTVGYALTRNLATKILNIIADEKVKTVMEKFGGDKYVHVLKESQETQVLVRYQLLGYLYNSNVEVAHKIECKTVCRLTQK